VNTRLACIRTVTRRLFVLSYTCTMSVLKGGNQANNCPSRIDRGKPPEKLFVPQKGGKCHKPHNSPTIKPEK
jgi:hypothetical protein